MTIHKCLKCNYETNRKGNLENHLKRKTPCDEVRNTDSQLTLIDSQLTLIDSQLTPVESRNKNPLECEYCHVIFSRKNNLNRHLSKTCKKKPGGKEEIITRAEFYELRKELKEVKETPKTIINNNNINIYAVPMDKLSIKYVFDMFFDSNLFYGGPEKVIEMLFEVHFKKDITLLDMSRRIFQYRVEDRKIVYDEDGNKDSVLCGESIIKDVHNKQALKHMFDVYLKRVNEICRNELFKYNNALEDGVNKLAVIENIECLLEEHIKMIKNTNHYWSEIWANTVGQRRKVK